MPSARKRVNESLDEEEIDEEERIIDDLETEDDGAELSSDAMIEKKYDKGQARIIIQRNDFLVPNLLQMFENKEVLDMSPTYQRRTRWGVAKRSHLIESLLMNIPIPPIFLYERDYAQYEVMDGQQRLASVRSFFRNEFKLRNLRIWPELNGRDLKDLPPKIKQGLERRGLAAVIILTESGKDEAAAMALRQYVFERLNTGGEQLNPQEIRNCLYASHFNDMLISIARNKLFTTVWGIPPKESGEPHKVSRKLERSTLYSKMADCEIVLRFFALADLRTFKSGMKRSLDNHMIGCQKLKKSQCSDLEQEYLNTLDLAYKVFGDCLFRLPQDGRLVGRRSVPLADAVMIAFSEYVGCKSDVLKASEKIVKGTLAAFKDEAKYELLVGRGNTRKDIDSRIKLMKSIISKSAGL